ncbi:DUF3995 domain-containing protein [Dyadobacter diqingensis]|jgi:hypothetical protein|uniref:DUF3995 domain-containing protein n=1 Tax=Dyadobacter diqingensis TaxID=2938121 RepID=UPI0020C5ADBE|nr:DUF3995 domain-containing protein [Dyadobacter diqingensis]
MITAIFLTNSVIFITLALIHIYWAFGGTWAAFAIIPTDSNGRRRFRPAFITITSAAAIFLVFAWVDLASAGFVSEPVPDKILTNAVAVIGLIFLLRAIGDFKYVGFAKRYRKTIFAKRDTLIFTPLCLIISVLHLALFFVYF